MRPGWLLTWVLAGLCGPAGCGDDLPLPCAPGQVECWSECVDLQRDRLHCGDCGAACAGGSRCVGGTCQPCAHACGPGQVRCVDATRRQVCVADADTCRVWGPAVDCGANASCKYGLCELDCPDACPQRDLERCSADGSSLEICDDPDGDGCLKWDLFLECGRCSLCSQGACVATCTDECEYGARDCLAQAWRECGDFDADEGFEWSEPTACQPDEICLAGGCEPALLEPGIDIYVDNFCNLDVVPPEVTVPAGQTAQLTYHNRSADYPVDVWLSYGGGYLDLACGQSWADPFEWCTGPGSYTGYADISTACSAHRLLIHCE